MNISFKSFPSFLLDNKLWLVCQTMSGPMGRYWILSDLYHFISYLHIITLMLTKWFYFSNFLDKCNAFHRYLTKFSYIVLLFSSPPQWPTTLKDFLSQISYFNSWERASISLFNVQCWTREILVPFLKRLWYDAVLDWGLKSGPPALEASTLPLGYRGGS